MKPVSEFLDWTRPLVETAAAKLYDLASPGVPADFSHLHVVVPTAEAARLLRERVAVLCAERGGATDLHISMPEQLIRRPATASEPQIMLAWLRTLRSAAETNGFPYLFRNDVLANFKRSDEILLSWGETLQQCRTRLAGEGLELADVAEKLNEMNGETAENGRFTDLVKLEKLYLAALRGIAGGAPDPAAALIAAIREPRLSAQVKTVVLIDCADLAGAPRRFLEKLDDVAVSCWINAPAEYCEHFDIFGCPLPDFWNRVPIGIDVEKRVRIVPRPDQQARRVLDLLLAAAAKGDLPSAVGVLDPEVADALEVRVELAAGRTHDRNGVPKVFVPREIPLAELPWSRLFAAIVRLTDDDTLAAGAEIWRSPLFDDFAASVLGIDRIAALELFDELRGKNFVDDPELLDRLLHDRRAALEAKLEEVDDAEKPSLASRLDRVEALRTLARVRAEWRKRLAAADDLPVEAFAVLGEIGGACRCQHLDLARSDGEIRELARIVAEIAALKLPGGASRLASVLLERRLAATRITPGADSPPDVDAVGFLELPWRNLRTMLIAGFNEESFDVGSGDDIFLPDNARAALGMMTRDRRRAADALRFAALAQSRDLYLLCGRSSQSGETLFPARLLFQCTGEELPRRVNDLLEGRLVDEPPPPVWGMPPFLPRAVPKDEMKKRMPITGFSTYLKCPASFYLERILGLQRQDPEPPELDPLAWGTFTHDVLQSCPRRKEDVAPGSTLEKTVLDIFLRKRNEWFGGKTPGLVRLQCGMIRDSLEYFCKTQEEEFAAGWEIVATEVPVDVPWGELYRAVFPDAPAGEWRDGITLSGKIDRIDRMNGGDGEIELRVLDYKTKKQGDTPKSVHLVSPRSAPPWAEERRAMHELNRKTGRIKTYYWADLQLPLYVLLTKHILPGTGDIPRAAKISAGYFDLPLELTGTGIGIFAELNDPQVLESAARCADRLLYKIFEERIFWPPAEAGFAVFQDAEIAMERILDPFTYRSGS